MIAEAIKQIVSNAAVPSLRVVEIGGKVRLFKPKPAGSTGDAVDWEELEVQQPDPVPPTLTIHTLTGLVDYVQRDLDKREVSKTHAVHVVNHQQVAVVGPLTETWNQRRVLALAQFEPLIGGAATPFKFGEFMQLEQFNIALQALFLESLQRTEVLATIGTIRDEKVRVAGDDGITQQVTAKAGVVLAGTALVPNPVTLAPYRTFREVEQPASKFVLRLKQGPEGGLPLAALFEADGGAWKLEAIRRISAFLGERLAGVTVFA